MGEREIKCVYIREGEGRGREVITTTHEGRWKREEGLGIRLWRPLRSSLSSRAALVCFSACLLSNSHKWILNLHIEMEIKRN